MTNIYTTIPFSGDISWGHLKLIQYSVKNDELIEDGIIDGFPLKNIYITKTSSLDSHINHGCLRTLNLT